MKNDCFYPGQEWRDTDGKLIQAHAGYMFIENGKYYWYGENKEKSLTEREIWHWGVRLYSSDDLYNWTDEGLIMPPELEDTSNPLYFNQKMDRPHILYNSKTGLYVMWLKIMSSKYSKLNYAAIATSTSIKGPFKLVKTNYLPNGFELGDFELVEYGGRGYIIYDKPHTELVISPLTEDYLSTEEERKSYFFNGYPPFIREAPATFTYKDKLFMITSGTTAKFPNPSETAVCDTIMGDWKTIGNPHVGNHKNTSFDSQISCIFKHPQKQNLYIAMADRWLIDLPENLPDVQKIFQSRYDKAQTPIPMNEADYTARNTSLARYVWLPVVIEDGVPVIRWYDSWRWEDFE